MAPRIEFTDGTGAATLTCRAPRLYSWTPDVDPWAEREEIPALGTVVEFTLAERAVVSFRIEYVAPSQIEIILRLKRHLMAGGTVTVHTEDLAARTYTCGLRGGTVPRVLYDPQGMWYGIELELTRIGSLAPMIAVYRA